MSASNADTGTFAFLRQLVTDCIRWIFGNPSSSEENLLGALQILEFEDRRPHGPLPMPPTAPTTLASA